jgi:hypothetical protein
MSAFGQSLHFANGSFGSEAAPYERRISAIRGQSRLFAIKRWTAPRLPQFERGFIAELAHCYTDNMDS